MLSYGFGAGGSYSLTRRLSWRASESLSSSLAQDSEILTTGGTVLPGVVARTNVASTSLGYLVSPKVQLEASVSETSVLFPGSEYQDGSSVAVQTRVSRQVGKNQSVGVSFGTAFSSGTTGDIQGLLATWQRTFGRDLTLSATGGVRPYVLYGVSGYQFAPGGSFALGKRWVRGQSFTIAYERAVEQAFGFNRTHLAHRINAGYAFALGRQMALDGTANYGLNTYPQIAGFQMGGRTATAGVRYLLRSQLSLGATVGVWNKFETGAPATTIYRAGVSLSYGGAWR
ncbi:MAG: hypothetical protein ABIQ52_06675 [Vicinamibacterales bacterium]